MTSPFLTSKDILKSIENKCIIDQIRENLGVDKLSRKPSYYFELPYSFTANQEILAKNVSYLSLIEQKAEDKSN